MMTMDQVIAYFEHTLAEESLRGDREGLRRTQLALSVLVKAAEHYGDRESSMKLRVLASRSANRQDELRDD